MYKQAIHDIGGHIGVSRLHVAPVTWDWRWWHAATCKIRQQVKQAEYMLHHAQDSSTQPYSMIALQLVYSTAG